MDAGIKLFGLWTPSVLPPSKASITPNRIRCPSQCELACRNGPGKVNLWLLVNHSAAVS
jgi:hypothetical protein